MENNRFDIEQETMKAQNKLIKVFTGGTAHNRRLLTNNDIYKIAGIERQVPIVKQPICEHCERVVIWDWEYDMFGREVPLAVCEYCGTITKNPMTYGEYLMNGYDIPATVTGAKRQQSEAARVLINMMFNMKGRNGVITE
jgi:hypothetical protein